MLRLGRRQEERVVRRDCLELGNVGVPIHRDVGAGTGHVTEVSLDDGRPFIEATSTSWQLTLLRRTWDTCPLAARTLRT
jgi:hypothetical protein